MLLLLTVASTSGFTVPKVQMDVRHQSLLAAPKVQMDVRYQSLLADVDALHAAGEHKAAHEMLLAGPRDDPEVLWRLARSCCDLSEVAENREKVVREGLAHAEEAMRLAPTGYANKWYGIMLGISGDFESAKKKIANAYKIKDALDVANAELQDDATVQLALGRWSMKLAGIGFFERKIAGALFAAPPAASYEDALSYFEKAYALKPDPKTQALIEEARRKVKP